MASISSSPFQTSSSEGFELDLHNCFSSFIVHYEKKEVPWFERTWGPLFTSFDSFLSFGWATMVVVDGRTGKAHIVIKEKSVGAFAKMVKIKFNESLPKLPNVFPIVPSAHFIAPLRNISAYSEYKKLHATLPVVELEALKDRLRRGDERSIRKIWEGRKSNFFMGSSSVGTASMRCAQLDNAGRWLPVPETNYRRSHLIVAPYSTTSMNSTRPNKSDAYALGTSYVSDGDGLVKYISSIVASLAGPDSDREPNSLVLVGHNIEETLFRFHELRRSLVLPSNVLIIDVATLERNIYRSLPRHQSSSSSSSGRDSRDRLSLQQTLSMLKVPVFSEFGNTGNDAFYALVAFQTLLDPSTVPPPPRYSTPPQRSTPATAISRPSALNTRRMSSSGPIPRSSSSSPAIPLPAPSTPSRPTRAAPPSAFAQYPHLPPTKPYVPPAPPPVRTNQNGLVQPDPPRPKATPKHRVRSTPQPSRLRIQ
ncbi:hypothetical protein BDY24DRAFT_413946 [Mrakia frigida]|uniref:uncharacterized protein n=1 Tax=Mrakia frigida TaxID=29902 RepID=UPI003FCC20B8